MIHARPPSLCVSVYVYACVVDALGTIDQDQYVH